MFNNSVVNVAVGLMVTFLAISIFVGIIVQTISIIMKWPERQLFAQTKILLPDRSFEGLARVPSAEEHQVRAA